MEKKFISAVIYLHNDEEKIISFLDLIIPTLSDYFEQYELVCVNDACTDDTVGKTKGYCEDKRLTGMVSIVHMGVYQGIETSMNAGRDSAIGDFVYEFDDISVDYPKNVITDIYEELISGYDIVSAHSDTKIRFTSGLFYSLYNKYNVGNSKIGPESIRIVSRRAINRIKSIGTHIPYRKAVYANCGLKMNRITYKSVAGNKKKHGAFSERGALALDSFIYFTNILEKISAVISGLFLIFTILMTVYAVVDHFFGAGVSEGWSSIICFMSLGFFGIFILLTIVLKYLSVLLNLIFKQQKYLVSDIEKVVGR